MMRRTASTRSFGKVAVSTSRSNPAEDAGDFRARRWRCAAPPDARRERQGRRAAATSGAPWSGCAKTKRASRKASVALPIPRSPERIQAWCIRPDR